MTSEKPPGTLAPFRIRDFRAVWVGAVLYTLAQWAERVAVGWFVFEQTDSAFVTAAAIAATAAPSVVIGPIAGAIADRASRPLVLSCAALGNAGVIGAIAVVALTVESPVAPVLVLVALSGVARPFQLAALHTLSGDIAGADQRARAISLVSTGQRAVSAVGALGSGAIIEVAGGAEWALGAGAVAFALSAASYRLAREPAVREGRSGASFVADTVEGLRIVGQYRAVAVLLGLAVVVEVFGFSYLALLPALADRVLDVGAGGLGGLTGAAGAGSVLGTLFLATRGGDARYGRMLLLVFAAFGTAMILLGSSTLYAASLLVAAVIGACAAMVDALEWIMLQASVPDRLRGRALGAWNVAIGLGWVGPLILGALADAVSIPAAFAVAGVIVLSTGGAAAFASPRLRSS